MTSATVSPPPPSNSCMDRDNHTNMNSALSPSDQIQSIVAKILSGTDVTTKADLRELDDALTQLNKDTEEEDKGGTGTVPFVDRDFLQSCASNPPMLVRFVGMVQDMMDPEYYVTQVDGVYTKYREYYSLQEDNEQQAGDNLAMGQMKMLAERQPLVIVPIPHTSHWVRDRIQISRRRGHMNMNMNMPMEEEEELECDTKRKNQKSKKRSLDEDAAGDGTGSNSCDDDENANDDSLDQDRRGGQQRTKSNANSDITSPNHDGEASKNQDCDWWPQGCLGSDPQHGPVLAKVYYEEDQEQARLQLNDLVEIYGILSLDPLGASFHGQTRGRDGDHDNSGVMMDDYYDQEDAFFDDFMCPLAIPPPSRLPRMHVLKYKTLNLDKDTNISNQMGSRIPGGTCMPQDIDGGEAGAVCNYNRHDRDHDRQLTIDTFALHLFQGDTVAAEALLMALVSVAERDHNYGDKPKLMPSGATLGCASLNYVLPSPEACQSLKNRLCALLKLVTPIVASADLTIPALNKAMDGSSKLQIVSSPSKNEFNRLEPSIMQLPKSSCFVLNQGAIQEGVVNESGTKTLASLAKMTRTHTVPYQFHGLMEIDFEADLRIIVLSSYGGSGASGCSSQGSRLLPCTMAMKTGYTSDTDLGSISSDTASRIRQYLYLCRAAPIHVHVPGGNNNSIALSKELLHRAQQDFVDRRQKFRSSEKNTIGEEDFHRWLTLTRLQARSRFAEGNGNSANFHDWEMALHLDDKMRA